MKIKKKPFLITVSIIAIVILSLFLVSNRNRFFVHKVSVKSGDTLSGILTPQDLTGTDILEIAKLLKKKAGINGLKADCDIVKIIRNSEDEPVQKITIQSGSWKKTEFTKTNGTWSCQTIEIPKETFIVRRDGEIKDGDSFYVAGIRANIPESILMDAYDLLAFEMDFERDMRAGQKFSILYEENHSDGKFVDTGSVIALKFDTGASRGLLKMYRYNKGYYDENGMGAIKSLKRTPINNSRVTSSFSYNRKHPVLGYSRAHKGVDFRASTGTPIPAAGSGRVVRRGNGNGYGNYIQIRHNATYQTLYAHMSRFQNGVTVGTQVRQGQIVGYVGATGIATGPHLHYEIIKDGVKVNPMTVKLPAISNISAAEKKGFMDARMQMDKSWELLKKFPSLEIRGN